MKKIFGNENVIKSENRENHLNHCCCVVNHFLGHFKNIWAKNFHLQFHPVFIIFSGLSEVPSFLLGLKGGVAEINLEVSVPTVAVIVQGQRITLSEFIGIIGSL